MKTAPAAWRKGSSAPKNSPVKPRPIFNFVATNTIEGRVLQRLLEKLQEIRDALDDDAVFNVVGEVLPSAHVERVLRDYYAGKLGDADLEDRLLKNVDERQFRAICQNALEGLASKKLNLAMLVERRDRRRKELEQQSSLSLRAVERITSVLVLPHPERETPEVRRLQPNLETEAAAMQAVIAYEMAQGRQVYDVHGKNLGYDITSLDLSSGELRLIEVKGLADAAGTILLTPNKRRVAEDRRDCYWLYIVTNCATNPTLQEPVKDPARFPWHEDKKVPHYWLEVDAMTKPVQVREDAPKYKIHHRDTENTEKG